MKSTAKKQKSVLHSHLQGSLLGSPDDFGSETSASIQGCRIVAVGKRRDGGTRYWCLSHGADATAKYGKPAKTCRAAHIVPMSPEDILALNVDQYQGGIALWGAVPAIYDTTRQPLDRGIHVHARSTAGGTKEMDCTFRVVRVLGGTLPKEGVLVSELDAIYYMVTSVFAYQMKNVVCTYCGHSHLDRDWFSVHPHRRHLCAACGRHFSDRESAIGNPICALRNALGAKPQKPKPSKKKLRVQQADFPGGIQIWGSNGAFVWTSSVSEEEGIHVHGYEEEVGMPDIDETYSEVSIDGVELDASMVRTFMAQSALPHLHRRVISVDCPGCGEPQFATGQLAFTPISERACDKCGREFIARGRLRKTIANPLPAMLERLGQRAPRQPQRHVMDLLPETL